MTDCCVPVDTFDDLVIDVPTGKIYRVEPVERTPEIERRRLEGAGSGASPGMLVEIGKLTGSELRQIANRIEAHERAKTAAPPNAEPQRRMRVWLDPNENLIVDVPTGHVFRVRPDGEEGGEFEMLGKLPPYDVNLLMRKAAENPK